MSEPAPDPPRSLEDLLQAWIDTETWKASHDFLATYAGQLLSDDALHTLDAMIAQGESKQDEADDREKREREQAILQLHRAILETARDSSIDEAYADLLKSDALQEELSKAIEALLAAKSPTEVLQVVTQHPLLLTDKVLNRLENLIAALQKAGQEQLANALQERYETLKQISAQAHFVSIPQELLGLIQAWINTDSWEESRDFLRANAEQLLSDETFVTFDALLAVNSEKEGAVRTLKQHQTILKMARDSSIEEAYIDLLISPVLQEAINALRQARPGGLPRVVEQHPLLLEAETIRVLLARASRIEREGDRASAQALRFRIGEVQRLRQQQERLQQNTQEAPSVQEGPQQVKMSATRGGFNVYRNEGTIHSTYVEHAETVITVPQEIAFPPLNWLPPAAPSHPEGRTFIGREQDLQELRDALLAGNEVATTGIAPTIMLHGMAGTGKTYLATQLAIEVQSSFPGGVLPVGLSGIRPKEDVQPTPEEKAQPILQDLAAYAFNGQKDQFTRPLQPGQVAAWLQQAAPGRLLVIFDDVWDLNTLLFLKQALPPAAGCIVTTRDATIASMLGGKRKELGRLSDQDSLDLLENRLGCVGNMTYRPALEHLVEMLEGHALALEIIAARIKRPERIQEVLEALAQKVGQARLDQLKVRGEETRATSVKAALALSYDFMSKEEQRRFRLLGVFEPEAPITVEAAAAIWNLQNDINAAKQALSNLEDLAMAERYGADYRLHSLLYDYAYALLEDEGELTAAKWSHAEYYRDLARKKNAPGEYLLLDQHIQNLLAALAWAVEQEPVLFADLLDASEQFLRLRSQYSLLEQYLPRAVEIAKATGNNGQRAKALHSLGMLERHLGKLDEARSHYNTALPLYREVRDRLGEANTLISLGDLERHLGRLDEARSHYNTALPLYREVQDRLGEANTLKSLGDLFLAQQDWNQAREHYEQALALSIDVHYPSGQAYTLIDLGRVRFQLGEQEQGIRDVQRAAALFQQLHEEAWARRARLSLALMKARLDQPAGAREEGTIFEQAALLHALLTVRASQDMLQLVERAPRLLSEDWFALVTAMIEAADDEDLKQALRERLESLQALRQALEQSAVAASRIAEAVLAFANADWTTRRELLADPQTPLLSEAVEPIFERLLALYEEDAHRQALAEVRTLLRRCRTWGVDAAWHFALYMRLGDSIDIPPEYEATIGQIAALLAQGQHDPANIEQAVAMMQALLDRLTASVPPLFEAALLWELADTLLALPKENPTRRLQTIEGYYREALPRYQEAERLVSVAFLQHALGDIVSEQGRYEEALEPLQAASEGWQAQDRPHDAAWALSAYAGAFESLGRSEEAIAASTRALSLLPDTPPLLRNRAEAFISARRFSEAEADLARAVELDGNEESSYLWLRRAQLAIARGDGMLGAQMLDEVLRRSPGEDVRFERAQCAGLRGETEAAQGMLRSAFEQGNAGGRAAMRRKWEQLRAEHPDLPAFPDL